MKIFLKLSWKRPLKCKTRVFHDWNESHTSRQKSMWQILKYLSKYFLRLEGPPTSKLWGESWTILSKTHDWSFHSWTSCQTESRKLKTQIFEIFLSLFHDWGLDLLESCQELLCKLVNGGSRLAEAESPKQSCTVFEIFQNKNTFQKQLKHSKNIFVFDQHMIKHVWCVWV